MEYIVDDYGTRLVDSADPTGVNDPVGYFPLLQNGQWYMVCDHRYPQTDAERELTVGSAMGMIGTGNYSIRKYNCEHFVTSLMLGLPFSHQSGVIPK